MNIRKERSNEIEILRKRLRAEIGGLRRILQEFKIIGDVMRKNALDRQQEAKRAENPKRLTE